jgi:hypothetical protein
LLNICAYDFGQGKMGSWLQQGIKSAHNDEPTSAFMVSADPAGTGEAANARPPTPSVVAALVCPVEVSCQAHPALRDDLILC